MLLALSATVIVIVALLWDLAWPPLREAYERHRARRALVPSDVDGYDPGRERRAEQRARELLRSCVNEEEWAMYRDLGFLRVWGGQAVEVILVESSPAFVSCPLSNLVLGGSKSIDDITVTYDNLASRHGVRIVQAWGMTETSPVAAVAHPPAGADEDDWTWRARTGRLCAGVELRIVGGDGEVLPWDGEAVGEAVGEEVGDAMVGEAVVGEAEGRWWKTTRRKEAR